MAQLERSHRNPVDMVAEALLALSGSEFRTVTISELAQATGLSPATVARVLKQMRAEKLVSVLDRGRRGIPARVVPGLRLKREAQE